MNPNPPAWRLVRPLAVHLPSYRRALERGYSPDNVRGAAAAAEGLAQIDVDAEAFLARMDDPEGRGPPVRLPDGSERARIPGIERWIWLGDDDAVDGFVGRFGLRWTADGSPLPPHVLGHIGYAVAPWYQRRGAATWGLAQVLVLARERGLAEVELTTDVDNEASQRVILANGGRLVGPFDKGEAYGHAPGLRFVVPLSGPSVPHAG